MRFSTVIAFTGSNLQDFHARYIESSLGLNLLRMNVHQHEKPSNNFIGASVHTTLTDQRKFIENVCVQQVAKTPVIIIIDDTKDQLLKSLQKRGLAVEDLAKQSFI
jgi:hypothetical protein